MLTLLKILSGLGLVLTIVPAILVYTQAITLDDHKNLMVIGMFLWFSTSWFWMKEKSL
ncbi:MAG: hypothetical protein WD355_01975 [Balneolaceae bacterium]